MRSWRHRHSGRSIERCECRISERRVVGLRSSGGLRMEKFINTDGGPVDRISFDGSIELSKKINARILACALECQKLVTEAVTAGATSSRSSEAVSPGDVEVIRSMSDDQQIVAGLMMLLSVILQMCEHGGEIFQVSALAIIAEEVRSWKNEDQMQAAEILSGLMISRKSGEKFN
jgi:hypothetical protein